MKVIKCDEEMKDGVLVLHVVARLDPMPDNVIKLVAKGTEERTQEELEEMRRDQELDYLLYGDDDDYDA